MEDNKANKINWMLFPHNLLQSITKGEEKKLTAEEIREVNELILQIVTSQSQLAVIFAGARRRFAAAQEANRK